MRKAESIATWELLDLLDDQRTSVPELLNRSLGSGSSVTDDLEPRHAYRIPSAEARRRTAREIEQGVGRSALSLQYENELPDYCR